MFGLDISLTVLLLLCLTAVVVFEFINGFHDTANAVATVIYTHTLPPTVAVVLSGILNFTGVMVGGIAVAMGIVNLLPTEALIDQNIYHGLAMILALLITAIIWNLGTWYFGIPCSSSHTLIGSIFGVGIAYMFLPGGEAIVLNWKKIEDTALSLLISPIFGFGLSFFLMLLLPKIIKNKKLYSEPKNKKAPPLWIRSILIFTCMSVSYSHGSNDGQKGVGLIMIILIGLVPIHFALNHSKPPQGLYKNTQNIELFLNKVDTLKLSDEEKSSYNLIRKKTSVIITSLKDVNSYEKLMDTKHFEIRKSILTLTKKAEKLFLTRNKTLENISDKDLASFKTELNQMKNYTEYAPWQVKLIVSISLGLGTMIGWKRIVVTIGEKIGKFHLTYAQGATAELVAASTISASTMLGLPVSTTHVLTSGVAGSMVAQNGKGNLQLKTIKNIAIAWLITLPVTIILSGVLFLLLRALMG